MSVFCRTVCYVTQQEDCLLGAEWGGLGLQRAVVAFNRRARNFFLRLCEIPCAYGRFELKAITVGQLQVLHSLYHHCEQLSGCCQHFEDGI